MIEYRYPSPLGTIRLIAEHDALTEARFTDEAADTALPTEPVLAAAVKWLDCYFQGHDPGPIPQAALCGTAFQTRVWNRLGAIPYGKTVSYAEFAEICGCPRTHARAVGSAVGKNPLILFLPCHRVLGSDGSLTGYAYGVERKRRLLEMETSCP